MLEHLVTPKEGVHLVVTGPGRFCCYNSTNLATVPDGAIKFMISGPNGHGPSVGPKPATAMLSGFSTLEFDDQVTLTMYKEDGTPLYTAPLI